MHPAGNGEGALQTSKKIWGSTTIGVDPTRSLESCAAPPEAVSTASPSSPQFLEQEERPSNKRARETCSFLTLQHAVSALRSTEFSPVESVPIKFRASEFLTILRTKIPCEIAWAPSKFVVPTCQTDPGRTDIGQFS